MTTSKSTPPEVVVVDGSNIATEGRSTPSLKQLNDAVMAFTEEYPNAVVTVVVDATFGHRIDKSEVKEFDAAIAHNELVAPPAGAIGRGDAFVLSIANKVGARILSNDSFQEFHGDYPWLFDEGRLIGGKPVPYVGWVFVDRLPVKGPTSRKAQRATRTSREPKAVRRPASREASKPMPVPTAPPPNARPVMRAAPPSSGDGAAAVDAEPAPVAEVATKVAPTATPTAGAAVNDLATFIDFVEHHPPGTSVNGVVDSYSSHGAYVRVGELRGYVPLRLMSDPPPRSAREVMRTGDAITLVVSSFAPARRSVDLAVPPMRPEGEAVAAAELEELAEAVEPSRPPASRAAAKRAARKAAAAPAEAAATDAAGDVVAADAADAADVAAEVVAAQLVTADAGLATPTVPDAPASADAEARPPARRAARTRAKKAAAEQAAEPAAAATKRAGARTTRRTVGATADVPAPPAETAPAKRTRAKAASTRAATKKAAATAAEADEAAATTSRTTRSATKKAAATRDAARPTPAKKAAAKQTPAKQTPGEKTAATRTPAAKTASKAATKKAAPKAATNAATKKAASTAASKKAAPKKAAAASASS